jgi:biopolymer transport protein ExbD
MEFIRPKKVSLGLDMAPLIDVVFQLLIFFMLTSSFSNPSLKLSLPKAVTQDKKEPEYVVVSIDKSGTVFVDRTQIQLAELKGALSAKLKMYPNKSVHFRGDQEIPYKLFVQVMDTARQAGASQINIVHQSDERTA